MLQAEGYEIAVLDFPETDHGIVEFESLSDGSRVWTRVTEGYYTAIIDFARDGRLQSQPYGRAARHDPEAEISTEL